MERANRALTAWLDNPRNMAVVYGVLGLVSFVGFVVGYGWSAAAAAAVTGWFVAGFLRNVKR